jgi:hypothetical protein
MPESMPDLIAASTITVPHHHTGWVVTGIIFGVLVLAGVVVIFWRGVNALLKRQAGWADLAQYFPVTTPVHKLGGRYKRRTGYFGHERKLPLKGMFLLEFAEEGVLVTASFARRAPLLIPWTAVRNLTETRLSGSYAAVVMSLNYRKEVKFHLPDEAILALGKTVPPERLSHLAALPDLIKRRSSPASAASALS